ncbi:beta-ketoacyl-ACP synthase III [bacterium endosymbiont of Pedicinus badii]|uniref:beta-ketoacyl-ACP synthase III n=1 Tax=bacterium endosymbiont of Pedicinus badii TaxID=1719126 RepID=UPI0009BAB496|nr:beta-ketoacyl-ACP synthase III [bacterium endosymbiont of Pedicinus badii]OQM34361.1 3-oxoacyl-ACP synthase [bacterium endosymbiont of Pedicinus badii]
MFTKIIGTGGYLPKKILSNFDLEKFINTSNEWIFLRTGIRERRIASFNETVSSMGEKAAKKAIKMAGINPKSISMIIVATTSSDYAFPSSACQIQHYLGIRDSIAFDLSAACAGFSYALSIADNYMKNGSIKYALVVGSDILSRVIDPNDKKTIILFGDGAGAVVLKKSKIPGIIATHLHANGKYGNLLKLPNFMYQSKYSYLTMSGKKVFKIAVKNLTKITKETIKKNKINYREIDWFIPHQANLRIIKAIIKKLKFKISQKKIIITLDKHGNTSSASIPLALDQAVRDGRIKPGQLVLLEAFGGGFTWGSALIRF